MSDSSLQAWASSGGSTVVQPKCAVCSKARVNVVEVKMKRYGEKWIVCIPCAKSRKMPGRLPIMNAKTGLPTGRYLN